MPQRDLSRFSGDQDEAYSFKGLSSVQTFVFALACGVMAANLYYAQPLIGLISGDLAMRRSLAGLIVTLAQAGYGVGLLFIVPLGDLVENRRLILLAACGVVLGLVGAATSSSSVLFLASYFLVGVCSVGAQVLIPLAAHLTAEKARGRVIGNLMGGLIGGIMLARPLASMVAAEAGWRAIFWVSAAMMLGIIAVLWRVLPRRKPNVRMKYGEVIASTLRMLMTERVLRRRALYQGVLFGTFNLFWTAAPLMLNDRFHLGQRGIALFALAGAGGALAAPLAGRAADRGWIGIGTAASISTSIVAFLAVGWAAGAASLIIMVVGAIALDAATQTNQVISQRVIYGLAPDSKSRVNAAYMTAMFFFGALGSVLAGFVYVRFGWVATSSIGAGLGAAILLAFATG